MTVREWLAPRLRGAPPELALAVEALVTEVATGERGEAIEPGGGVAGAETEIPWILAAAALRGFDAVLGTTEPGHESRSAALRLLAADASLTYAFEAAADLRAGALELADRLGPGGVLGAAFGRATARTGGAS